MWQGRLNLRNKKCNKIVLDKQEGRNGSFLEVIFDFEGLRN